jgi:hypothetical protein
MVGAPSSARCPGRRTLQLAWSDLIGAVSTRGLQPCTRGSGVVAGVRLGHHEASPVPPAVAEALTQLHDSIQDQIKDAAQEYAKKRPNGIVANLLGADSSRRRLQTIGVVSQAGEAGRALRLHAHCFADNACKVCTADCGPGALQAAPRAAARLTYAPLHSRPPQNFPPPASPQRAGLPRLPVQLLRRQLGPVRAPVLVLRQLRLDQPGRVW